MTGIIQPEVAIFLFNVKFFISMNDSKPSSQMSTIALHTFVFNLQKIQVLALQYRQGIVAGWAKFRR